MLMLMDAFFFKRNSIALDCNKHRIRRSEVPVALVIRPPNTVIRMFFRSLH